MSDADEFQGYILDEFANNSSSLRNEMQRNGLADERARTRAGVIMNMFLFSGYLPSACDTFVEQFCNLESNSTMIQLIESFVDLFNNNFRDYMYRDGPQNVASFGLTNRYAAIAITVYSKFLATIIAVYIRDQRISCIEF